MKPMSDEMMDDFVKRFMDDTAMMEEYSDEEKRRAAALAEWKKHRDEGMTRTLTQEILDVGVWNGREFTADDIDGIVQAFADLKSVHKVPLKFGHDDEGMQAGDGYPALGWVSDVKRVGTKLVATLTDVPAIVYEAMTKKLYRTVSAELLGGVTYKDAKYKWVLDGLALLGADIPAVNTLNDLAAYLSVRGAVRATERASFKMVKGNIEDRQMMTPEEKARLDALEAAVTKLTGESVQLKAENTQLKAEQQARAEAEKKATFAAARKAIGDELEALVKDSTIAPAQRDEALGLIKEGDEASLSAARATLAVLKKSPGVKVKTKENADGRGKDEPQGKPSEVLASRVMLARAANPKLSHTDAVRLEMQKDPDLAKAYVTENGEHRSSVAH